MQRAFIRMRENRPQVKFPGRARFVPLTAQFDCKPLERVVEMLKQLPANEGIEFEIVELKGKENE